MSFGAGAQTFQPVVAGVMQGGGGIVTTGNLPIVPPVGSAGGSFKGFMNVITGITDVVGGVIQSRAQTNQATLQAQAFQYNAAVLQQRAALARQSAQLDIERQRRRARRFTGEQRAAFAAAGVKLAGSPLEVITADAAELLLDQEITRFNAESQAVSLEADANNSLMQAQIARSTGFIKSGTTLLSTIPRISQRLGFGVSRA